MGLVMQVAIVVALALVACAGLLLLAGSGAWRARRRRPPALDPEIERCHFTGRRHRLRALGESTPAHARGARWQCPDCLLLVREEPEASQAIEADAAEMNAQAVTVERRLRLVTSAEGEQAMARAIESLPDVPGVERVK